MFLRDLSSFQGEKDCPYYMRTGSCKYGSNCRFHHPDPSTVAGGDPSSGYNGGSAPVKSAPYPTGSSWSSPRALNGTASFVPVVYPASQGIPLSPQWNGYLVILLFNLTALFMKQLLFMVCPASWVIVSLVLQLIRIFLDSEFIDPVTSIPGKFNM